MSKKVNTLGILIKISFLGAFIFYEHKMYEEYKRSKRNLEYSQKTINKEVRDSFLLRKEKTGQKQKNNILSNQRMTFVVHYRHGNL